MSEPTGDKQLTDDSDVGWGERPTADEDDDARLLEDRPPHHDDRS
ncbi:MAG: hypothetical protein QOG49_1409 [Frankiaceae bacterium]|nr:hypothetical protein [Frankiaceae bacterium]